MDQGGVKHCQRGTLKQRDHSKNYLLVCLLQLFGAYVTECTARAFPLFSYSHLNLDTLPIYSTAEVEIMPNDTLSVRVLFI